MAATSAAVLQALSNEQGAAITYMINQNNEEQQKIIKDTILAIVRENNQARDATHKEFDLKHQEVIQGLEQVKVAMQTLDAAQKLGEATMKGQTDFINAEFLKAQKLASDLSDMDFKMAELNTDVIDKATKTQGELNELLRRSRLDFDKLVATVGGELSKIRAEIHEAATTAGFQPRADDRRGKSLVDSRDYKVSQMPESCNAEQFKKWRHDAVVFLEAHPRWKGARRVLAHLRKQTKAVDHKALYEAITAANVDSFDETGEEVIVPGEWQFLDRSRELYQLLSVKLSSSYFADYKDEEGMNGFELYRQLNKALDPIRQDVAFHLRLRIQNMGAVKEESFEKTYLRMGELEKLSREYKATVGEPVKNELLASTLYAFADDETTNTIDKDESMDKEHEDFYVKFKEWLAEKHEKLAGRSAVRSHQRAPRSSAMQVGALASGEDPGVHAGSPVPPVASATAPGEGADPWQGEDPWTCRPCTGDGWSGGDLDAFGKGKGKGKKGPMICYNCEGENHPARLCPSPPNCPRTGSKCTVCGGYNHAPKDCTSPGGGKHVPQDRGKDPKGGKYGGKKGAGKNPWGKSQNV